MELTSIDENELYRLIKAKMKEKEGKISEADQNEIALKFLMERQSRLKDNDKESSDVASTPSALSTHVKQLHESNVILIHRLIDKVERNVVADEVELSDSLRNEMSTVDSWDFSLGDRVVVDLPRGRFKFIQKQTLGWTEHLGNVLGQHGFITKILSKYDCKVAVFFPDILTNTMVHTVVLRKSDKVFNFPPSRWNVGDMVRTKRSKILVSKFQKRLPDFPERHIGKKGMVTAVTHVAIYVTFNGRSSYALDSALLQEAEEAVPIAIVNVTDHPCGFTVGSKVKVIKNIRKLIENQKGFGGWNWKMSSLAGRIVRIQHIKKRDGSLIVGLKNQGRTWRLSYESARFEHHTSCFEDDFDEPLPFMPGDKVRFRVSESVKVQLISAKVLESCIDFLKSIAVVEGIDDELNIVVRFSNGKKRILKPSMIQKVRGSEEKKYEAMEQKRLSLTSGNLVRISVGPTRYVQEILSKIKMKESTRKALTQESELLGFTDEEHALIRYEDGRKIKINSKYLAPVENFQEFIPKKISFDHLRLLIETVQNCVAAANFERDSADIESSVDIFSVTSGVPPTVCLCVDSPTATPDKIIGHLKRLSGWTIYDMCDNECFVKMYGDVELDLVLISHVEKCYGDKIEDLMDSINDENGEQRTFGVANESKSSEKVESVPLDAENIRRDVRVDQNPLAQQPPPVQGWGDFRFITFHTTGGDLYFPYIPHSNAAQVEVDNRRPNHDNSVNTNIIIQGNVGSVNQNV